MNWTERTFLYTSPPQHIANIKIVHYIFVYFLYVVKCVVMRVLRFYSSLYS